MSLHPYTPLMQSRSGVRPVKTEARVGEQTVPPECESCISMEPARLAHAAMCGVLAVPLFHEKSAHPMSSPKIMRKDGSSFPSSDWWVTRLSVPWACTADATSSRSAPVIAGAIERYRA